MKKRNCSAIQREITRQGKRQKRTGCGNGPSSARFRYARMERKSRMVVLHSPRRPHGCSLKKSARKPIRCLFRGSLCRRFLHELVEKNRRLLNNSGSEIKWCNMQRKCKKWISYVLPRYLCETIKFMSFINIQIIHILSIETINSQSILQF